MSTEDEKAPLFVAPLIAAAVKRKYDAMVEADEAIARFEERQKPEASEKLPNQPVKFLAP
jgi:hypothetical protein